MGQLPRLTVTQLNNQLKGVVDAHFPRVVVEGEVSRPNLHSSTGHFYFTLKDSRSSIDGVVWKSWVPRIGRLPKEGEKVVVEGRVSLFLKGGKCTLQCYSITPLSNRGDLARQLEELKEKLRRKGYFDPARKKPIPQYPKRIGIITSKSGAALRDMIRIARNRWRLTELYIFDTLVQGEGAPLSIARTIQWADWLADRLGLDLLIVGRGGGSLEDLWAFNTEVVADAIFHARTPIISAVGHEIDHLLSDDVADLRASTPSNSIELALPDQQEERYRLMELERQLEEGLRKVITRKQERISHLRELLDRRGVGERLERKRLLVEKVREQLLRQGEGIIAEKRRQLEQLRREFHRLSPNLQLSRWEQQVEGLKTQFHRGLEGVVARKGWQLEQLPTRLEEGVQRVVAEKGEEVEEIGRQLRERVEGVVAGKEGELARLKELLEQLNPRKGRQFLAEIWREGEQGLERVTLPQLRPGDRILLVTPDGEGVAEFIEFRRYQ